MTAGTKNLFDNVKSIRKTSCLGVKAGGGVRSHALMLAIENTASGILCSVRRGGVFLLEAHNLWVLSVGGCCEMWKITTKQRIHKDGNICPERTIDFLLIMFCCLTYTALTR